MRQKYLQLPTALATMMVVTGCASVFGENSRTAVRSSSSSATSTVDLESAQRRVSELESVLADRERQIANAQAQSATTANAALSSNGDLFPPNPKAGECYARVLIPAQTRTISDRVVTREASERIEIIPARYEPVQETVIVREASTRLEIVPAIYDEVQERVLVKPATTQVVEVPARYETVTEEVVETPAHTEWKKGPAAIQTANVLTQTMTDTGEVMCLVEVPATYRTVERRVLVSPARTEEVTVPAEYEIVTKTVVLTPATTREVTIPAEYETVEVAQLVAPASENRISIPAEYETVTRTERTSEERVEWRQVMCEVNMTRTNIMALQRALTDKGYYQAGVDGIIGSQTLAAAQSFANDNNLPAGSNYISIEVVEALGLDI